MCVLCVSETRVCLSAFCHPAIGDSFNCSMTTTRKDQKPRKSQSKLAAVPQWKASHAIITGKKTSSTAAQHRIYMTPIMQLCRYPNNTLSQHERTTEEDLDTASDQGKVWLSGRESAKTPPHYMKVSAADLDLKKKAHQCKLHCSQSKKSLTWH